ncbi:hypothetical protein L596_030256 [Steinernema carpocapsae]|uniref:Uncharacterized protein n=1 Tax=Steinernema carpocapsae TaxID=34508 RepID=A0A4U5LS73_STECR|nr:hypothetical protein L596_030256 [Steinernema carpocapsae]
MRVSTGLLLLALVGLSTARVGISPSAWARMNEVLTTLPNDGFLPYTNGTFKQKIDHNANANLKNNTWDQHYQQMSEYHDKKAKDSLVFLMIGGEGAATPNWVANKGLQYIQWAKEFGAMVFQLEHRFFGASQPFTIMSTENLKYLTTHLALEDLANFINTVNADPKKYGLQGKPRWITFGGSYPGSMAAWFRSQYPSLTLGSVASSAPLWLKLDFYEYTMVMEDTIRNESAACYNTFNKTFTMLQQKTLTTDGRNFINKNFGKNTVNLTPLFNDNNVTMLQLTNFLSNVYDVVQGVIQYTYDGRNNMTVEGYNVHTMCNYLTGNGTKLPNTDDELMTNLVKFLVWSNKANNVNANLSQNAFNNDYKAMIAPLQATNYSDTNGNPNFDMRGWMWLCCNELGWFQTTSQGYTIFQDIVPLGFYFQQCEDIFGDSINASHVRDQNHIRQNAYGGYDYFNATNLVLPNGSLDPWHALGYYKADNKNHVVPHLTPGTAHCSDMYEEYPGEPSALKEVRKVVHDELNYYINGQKHTKFSAAATYSMLLIAVMAFVTKML